MLNYQRVLSKSVAMPILTILQSNYSQMSFLDVPKLSRFLSVIKKIRKFDINLG
jgi:hypothetical protein